MEAPNTKAPEPMMTTAEVAEWLGFHPRTISAMYERGELPGIRVGRRLRFRRSEIEQKLEGES